MLIERNAPTTSVGRTFSLILRELIQEAFTDIELETYYSEDFGQFCQVFAKKLAREAIIYEKSTGIPFDVDNTRCVEGFRYAPAAEKMWFDGTCTIFCLEQNMQAVYDDYDAIGGLVVHSLGHLKDMYDNSIFTLPGFTAITSPFDHLGKDRAYQLARLALAVPLEYRAQVNAIDTGNIHYLFEGLTSAMKSFAKNSLSIASKMSKNDFQKIFIEKMYTVFHPTINKPLALELLGADPSEIGSLAAMYSHDNIPQYMKDVLKKLSNQRFFDAYTKECSHFSLPAHSVQKASEIAKAQGSFYNEFVQLLSGRKPYSEEIVRQTILEFIK
jgi:hypothetical protein